MRSSPSALRSAGALLSGVLLAGLLVVVGVSAEPEEIGPDALEPAYGSTYLCYGYSGCREAGYGNAGYAAVNDRSYWNMYPGHNCTNYVAYRMIQAGMSSKRPFGYPGNATNWGQYMSNITDRQPRVGAVAWWKAYDNGSGRAGHVAYVEKVTSDYIIISEDSWGGTFTWRKILRTSNRWPTGFIHFVDKVIENTKRPQIQGTAKLGEVLTTTAGGWNVPNTTKKYGWFVDGVRVRTAKTATFEVAPAHVGKKIQAKVVAKKKGWEKGRKRTYRTPAAQPGDLVVSAPPTVTGKTLKGEILQVDTGRFTPTPDAVDVQWLADGKPISGATKRRLKLTKDHIGAHLTARVTARKAAYRNEVVTSEPTDWIRNGYVKALGGARIKGRHKVGGVLTAVPGEARPSGTVEPAYQWLRDGDPIAGATERKYRLTADDFARAIGVQVTYQHPRRYAVQKTVTTTRPIRARTRVLTEVTTKGATGQRVIFKIQVVSRQTNATVRGKVTVLIGDRRERVRLEDGAARIVFRGMPHGRYDARVLQHGNRRFVRSVEDVRVKVRP